MQTCFRVQSPNLLQASEHKELSDFCGKLDHVAGMLLTGIQRLKKFPPLKLFSQPTFSRAWPQGPPSASQLKHEHQSWFTHRRECGGLNKPCLCLWPFLTTRSTSPCAFIHQQWVKLIQSWALNQNVTKRISKHSGDCPSNAQRPFYTHNIVDIIAYSF